MGKVELSARTTAASDGAVRSDPQVGTGSLAALGRSPGTAPLPGTVPGIPEPSEHARWLSSAHQADRAFWFSDTRRECDRQRPQP